MDERTEDDELEIGEITERDSPDRITRPPNDELIEYDRGNKKNGGSSSGGEERDRRSKRVFWLYIVIAILCISAIFLCSGVNDLGNRIDCINQSLTEKIGEMEEDYDNRMDSISQSLTEKIGEMEEDYDNKMDSINQSLTEKIGRIDVLESKINDLEKLLPLNYTGNVSLNKSIYHINESANVTVDDKDRNINSK